MQKYDQNSGHYNTWHYESTGKETARQLVVQLYINDIDEAGETEFLYQNKRIAPKRNRMLIWPADWTHTHRGNPPIGDKDKYILTTWLEEKRIVDKQEALRILDDIKDNINVCCAITMEPDEVLVLIDKLESYIKWNDVEKYTKN